MILFTETRAATLEDVRWLRKNLGRRLRDSCLEAIDPRLHGRRLTLSLIDSVLLAITETANNIVQHASPKPTFLSLEVRLAGNALRIEFCNDGGSFEEFQEVLKRAGLVRHSADLICGRGLSLLSQSLQNLEYYPGDPNRLIGWRKLRKLRPHVLIVEKDPDLARDLQIMLSQNYNVTRAGSTSEAKTLLSKRRPDVMLAAYEAENRAKWTFDASFDECPIPVILMAEVSELEEMPRRPYFHADQLLPKPISTPILIASVEIALASYTRRLIHLANHFGRGAGVLLAEELPQQLPGFNLEVLSGTASYGGGDFGLALEGRGFTRLVVADIMGHGLKAKAGAIALSAIVRTLHCKSQTSPGALLANLSHIVASEPAFTDIISTLIIVDAGEDGWIEAASAGHPPIAIVSTGGSFVLPVTGPLPGLLGDPTYVSASYQLQQGDKLAIVTDGIDSQSAASAAFPVHLLERLSKDPSRPLALLKQDMERWLGRKLGPAPKDDWTLVMAQYVGTPSHSWRHSQESGRDSARASE